jgi:hypothetical protein
LPVNAGVYLYYPGYLYFQYGIDKQIIETAKKATSPIIQGLLLIFCFLAEIITATRQIMNPTKEIKPQKAPILTLLLFINKFFVIIKFKNYAL